MFLNIAFYEPRLQSKETWGLIIEQLTIGTASGLQTIGHHLDSDNITRDIPELRMNTSF
ncbi:hypothetical protein K402DRAFT_398633 [Aulographum hederae CBS 113979]|uniref:Uncharacterized protein n=1 Tax=Aulographum hederae CBS 113979 TaxID=1176131 RepID=A0A6G1GK87_9PEZI|nr:hypothetical protein K402DRAFT_398633 [Aulographum hederae CBS 113979]